MRFFDGREKGGKIVEVAFGLLNEAGEAADGEFGFGLAGIDIRFVILHRPKASFEREKAQDGNAQ